MNMDMNIYIAVFTTVIACLGFFIKKWITDLEKKIDDICGHMDRKMNTESFDRFVEDKCDRYSKILMNHSHNSEGKVVIN